MAPLPNGYTHCQYPKAARKAAMLLAGPIVDIRIIADPQAADRSYKTEPYTVYTNNLTIPPMILRDLTCNTSNSLAEFLLKAVKSPQLEQASSALAEHFAQAFTALKTLASASMEDKKVDEATLNHLNVAATFLESWKNDHSLDNVRIMGFEVSAVIPHIAHGLKDIANQMIREANKGSGMGGPA